MGGQTHVVPTYRYAAMAFAPVASPTDIIIIKGSATKTLIVKRVKICGAATAAGTMPAAIVRRSDAGTLGSAVLTAITGAKSDSTQATATGVVSTVGTANYTAVGTTAGNVGAGRLQLTALSTGVAAVPLEWDFAVRDSKGLYLRGILEFLCVNLNGAAIPAGGVIDYEIEIEEIAP
tara:strand:- start:360 stop:890 length:531 start_codon:yes stop_codon:yes gene_type:complete